jgi:hypothetical protein
MAGRSANEIVMEGARFRKRPLQRQRGTPRESRRARRLSLRYMALQ